MVYADGMKATVNGRHEDVKKVNGIMTAIPVNKGDTHIRLTYTPPHWHLLFIMSILGIFLSIAFRFGLKKSITNRDRKPKIYKERHRFIIKSVPLLIIGLNINMYL